ncbi:MAG: hypothetical protein HOO88_02045 [Kiritimatiellaceae bacterium]|nr:hypothetical protein [Kiritimatiellaceae bacterium]
MKTIFTAVILLAATAAFAESKSPSDGVVTNIVTVTNADGTVIIKAVPAKADAYTGATRKGNKRK